MTVGAVAAVEAPLAPGAAPRGPSAVSEPESAVWLVSVAKSDRATRAERIILKFPSSSNMFFSKSLRYLVMLAWLQTSGCLMVTTPSSRIFSSMASIDRATWT